MLSNKRISKEIFLQLIIELIAILCKPLFMFIVCAIEKPDQYGKVSSLAPQDPPFSLHAERESQQRY